MQNGINSLLSAVFTTKGLATHSLTGVGCNVHKDQNPNPALSPEKVVAVKGEIFV